MRDSELVGQLTLALGRANTPRMTPRAIGEALSERWRALVVRLSLVNEAGAQSIDAKRERDDRWTTHQPDPSTTPRPTIPTAPSLTESREGRVLSLPFDLDDARGLLVIRTGAGERIEGDPTYLSTLVRVVELALGHQQLLQRVADLSRTAHAENRRLRESLLPSEIVARSPQMRDVVRRLAMVARYNTVVLVRGESGVGKELVSREIHRRSPRSRHPFVQINCGAIPGQLVESELFGHEKGAFTGADRTHQGVFEQANRGTLMLDEVGELPLDVQVKLLRVLQEGKVRRVGAEREVEVDVRVIAATNRDLQQMVQDRSFREDLYYRLNVFPILIPPLRDRPDDLPPLVRGVTEQLATRLGVSKPAIPRDVLSRLGTYSWPGNVRELSNVLETSIILGGGRTLELPTDFGTTPVAGMRDPVTIQPLEDSIRAAIDGALRVTRGKVYGQDGAAAALGLHPATLQSKMRKLGINRTDYVSP